MEKKERRLRARKFLRELAMLGALVLVTLAARSSLADHVHVPTGSMRPTVQVGARLFVDKTAYGLRVPFSNHYLVRSADPRRGDVVVLSSPEDGETLLKRVVALPGDRVQVRAGQISIDGHLQPVEASADGGGLIEQLDGRPHAVRLTAGGGPDLPEVQVPDDHYLVMGDNRGNSRDGRSFGFVPRRLILGRAVAVFHDRAGWAWKKL